MLNFLTVVESILVLQLTVLAGGLAVFFAVVLSPANPLCVWLEWADACGDNDEDNDNSGRSGD